jgi:hypothetical protein
MSNIYILVGAIGALVGSSYMLYEGIKHPFLWHAARWVYYAVAMLDLYLAGIYALTLMSILTVPGYGDYVRPVLLPIVTAPAIVAWINRRAGL